MITGWVSILGRQKGGSKLALQNLTSGGGCGGRRDKDTEQSRETVEEKRVGEIKEHKVGDISQAAKLVVPETTERG